MSGQDSEARLTSETNVVFETTVASKTTVVFETSVLTAIEEAAATAYPFEGCGALLGNSAGSVRRVCASLHLPNREEGRPRVRFEVSPADYLSVEDEADRRGLSLLGFWHTHPDHPALPSATDRQFAWEGLLTVIVSVPERRPREITAWEVTGPDSPFSPVLLREDGRNGILKSLAGRPRATQED
ncbi:MAG: hypothetical protein DIJKHBIC_03853 [Thermoanaerobaculia bacterium]|nr:hypothetical protein [Thermoanaerobaculia bacterium]